MSEAQLFTTNLHCLLSFQGEAHASCQGHMGDSNPAKAFAVSGLAFCIHLHLFLSNGVWKYHNLDDLNNRHLKYKYTYIFKYVYLNLNIVYIYLAAPGGSELWHAGSSLRHEGSFSCGMWDLVPWPGTKPRPPVLGGWSLSLWTTRVLQQTFIFSWLQRPEVGNQGVSRAVLSLKMRGKNLFHECLLVSGS